MAAAKTNSRTVADTIVGEHEHTICGYSLLKGIGDGEPVASERFNVGGHDWVLLFYPDGKKSSSSEHHAHHVDPRALLPPGQPNGDPPIPAGEGRNARDHLAHLVGTLFFSLEDTHFYVWNGELSTSILLQVELFISCCLGLARDPTRLAGLRVAPVAAIKSIQRCLSSYFNFGPEFVLRVV